MLFRQQAYKPLRLPFNQSGRDARIGLLFRFLVFVVGFFVNY